VPTQTQSCSEYALCLFVLLQETIADVEKVARTCSAVVSTDLICAKCFALQPTGRGHDAKMITPASTKDTHPPSSSTACLELMLFCRRLMHTYSLMNVTMTPTHPHSPLIQPHPQAHLHPPTTTPTHARTHAQPHNHSRTKLLNSEFITGGIIFSCVPLQTIQPHLTTQKIRAGQNHTHTMYTRSFCRDITIIRCRYTVPANPTKVTEPLLTLRQLHVRGGVIFWPGLHLLLLLLLQLHWQQACNLAPSVSQRASLPSCCCLFAVGGFCVCLSA
jgi:hypothetical protein